MARSYQKARWVAPIKSSHWDFFTKLLDHDNNILKWNAIYIIAQLSKVDKDNKFNNIFEKYYNLIKEKKMITAANVVKTSPIIIKSKPKYERRITKRLLATEKGS